MRVGIVSFRLGAADGVSRAAALLARSFADLGHETLTVAGEGAVDRLVPGLSPAGGAPSLSAFQAAIDDLDLVVVENLLTIPLHLPASRVVAEALRGRPAVLRHFDPPWQRARFAHVTELPVDDPEWLSITVSRYTERQLRARGIPAVTHYLGFDAPGPADRAAARSALGVADNELLCLHPVRAIERKNVPAALDLVHHIGGTYWLSGAAEEDYAATAERIVAEAPVRTIWRGFDDMGVDNAYAAADLVVFPSTWEGFGLPPIEAAFRRRLVVVGDYPVGRELRSAGFEWPACDDVPRLDRLLGDPADRHAVVEHNLSVAEAHFSQRAATERLAQVLEEWPTTRGAATAACGRRGQ